ncbi:gamma-glutamylcyclotransferase [Candidatus Saccharibacteria bacterium]|nr:gamma-glutamylcyclotransferase [Candidatus Saccharibacteria bacterium]
MSDKKAIIKYFGFGTNKDLAMMQHIVGRDGIKGVPGRLIGYEICIQKAKHMRTLIPPTSPAPKTPRELITNNWYADFPMFVSRPNPLGIAYGTIWYLTPDELDLVRNWEAVDFGVQDDAYGWALDDNGELHQIITQSFVRPEPVEIDQVIEGSDYEPYIEDKQAMLDKADLLRKEYLAERSS